VHTINCGLASLSKSIPRWADAGLAIMAAAAIKSAALMYFIDATSLTVFPRPSWKNSSETLNLIALVPTRQNNQRDVSRKQNPLKGEFQRDN